MAYIVSPYAGAAEFPSDNLPAQLLSQGLQAGYARRMKEMENKMKLEEEGKKARDEAFKGITLDLSKTDEIFWDDLKRENEKLYNYISEEYKKDPRVFVNNPTIAKLIEAYNTKKSQYENLTANIEKQKTLKATTEKDEKKAYNVQNTEFGDWYNKFYDLNASEEDIKNAQNNFTTKVGSGTSLFNLVPNFKPRNWEDITKEANSLQETQDKRSIFSTPEQIDLVKKRIINDPATFENLAKDIGEDFKTEEGKANVLKKVEALFETRDLPPSSGGGKINIDYPTQPLSAIGIIENAPVGTGLENAKGQKANAVYYSTLPPIVNREINSQQILPANSETKDWLKDNTQVRNATIGPPYAVAIYKKGIMGHPLKSNGKYDLTESIDLGGTAVPIGKEDEQKGKYTYKLMHDVSWNVGNVTYYGTTPYDNYTANMFMLESNQDKPLVAENQRRMLSKIDELNSKLPKTTVKPTSSTPKKEAAGAAKMIKIKGKDYPESKIAEKAKESGMSMEEYINFLNSEK